MAFNMAELPYFPGFGYSYDGQYFQNQQEIEEYMRRMQERNNNLQEWGTRFNTEMGAPASANPWDTAGQYAKGQNIMLGGQAPSTPVVQSLFNAPKPNPGTLPKTTVGTNVPGGPNNNTGGSASPYGGLPNYYQTASNPYTQRYGANNPNFATDQQNMVQGGMKNYGPGQMSYLMGRT